MSSLSLPESVPLRSKQISAKPTRSSTLYTVHYDKFGITFSNVEILSLASEIRTRARNKWRRTTQASRKRAESEGTYRTLEMEVIDAPAADQRDVLMTDTERPNGIRMPVQGLTQTNWTAHDRLQWPLQIYTSRFS